MDRKRTAVRIGTRKQLLAEEVYSHIAEAIISGEYQPGQRIRDVDLAGELHVSRMPVREALQRLERIGLVRMYPSRYTEVTMVTAEDVEIAQEFAAYQCGFVARMAAERMNSEARVHAIALTERAMESPPENQRTTGIICRDLFSYLSAQSGNPLQHRLLEEAGLTLARNLQRLVYSAEALTELHLELRMLREALMDADSDRAEHAARAIHGVGMIITPE